jgi:hypothetical protein
VFRSSGFSSLRRDADDACSDGWAARLGWKDAHRSRSWCSLKPVFGRTKRELVRIPRGVFISPARRTGRRPSTETLVSVARLIGKATKDCPWVIERSFRTCTECEFVSLRSVWSGWNGKLGVWVWWRHRSCAGTRPRVEPFLPRSSGRWWMNRRRARKSTLAPRRLSGFNEFRVIATHTVAGTVPGHSLQRSRREDCTVTGGNIGDHAPGQN